MSAMDKAELVGRQSNVHDGTVLLYEYDNRALDGAYVTILGRANADIDELPSIIAFGLDDLRTLADLYAEISSLAGDPA